MADIPEHLTEELRDEPKYSILVILLLSILSFFYFIFLMLYWGTITKVFTLFENSNIILMNYYAKIANLFFVEPNFTEIAIVIAFILGIFYIILSLQFRGHMVFSQARKDVHEQNALISFFILTFFY